MADQPGLIRLALFGGPVAHSLSPRIHGLFAQQLGLQVEYRAIECSEAGLAGALGRLARNGGRGCNLTVPLKRRAAELATSLSERAQKAGAVNTLIHGDGLRWHGENTDGPGLVRDLCANLGFDLGGARIALIGAGGAAAGVLYDLLQQRPARLLIANRTEARARALALRYARHGPVEACTLGGLGDEGPFDLLLNATSTGHEGEAPPLEGLNLTEDGVCYDLNYGVAHRPMAEYCRRLGLRCHGGLGMLVEQAAESFTLWTGRTPDTAAVIRALEDLA